MQLVRSFAFLVLLGSITLTGQEQEKETKRKGPGPQDISTDSLISESGPSFRVHQTGISQHAKVIVFGDQRFY